MGKDSGNQKKDTGTPLLVVGSSAKSGLSLLDGHEFSATPCLDARDALRMLSQGRHQVVLCDLEMPGMGGMVLVNSVHAGFPDVAVVVITRPGKLRHGILAMIAGASGYVQAPLQPEIVAASLRSALRRKQLDSAMRG
jgi:DNA-binding NtrC family response regulator